MILFLLFLPVLIAMWIGLAGLAKGGREAAWWTMTSGVAFVTLGVLTVVVSGFLVAMAFRRMGSSSSVFATPKWVEILPGLGIGSLGLGMLLFAIGFAIHGMKGRRLRQRIDELETVIAAQNEQLAQQSPAPSA